MEAFGQPANCMLYRHQSGCYADLQQLLSQVCDLFLQPAWGPRLNLICPNPGLFPLQAVPNPRTRASASRAQRHATSGAP